VKVTSALAAARVEELVLRHQDSVRGFLLFLGCPAAKVDDLVQDAFLAVLSGGFADRGDASAGAYLRKVARHLFLKSLRNEERRPRVLDLAAAEGAWTRFEGDDGGDRYLQALRHCLEGLAGRPREVLDLRYHENLQRNAIARALGLSESGVKSILVRTRQRLRDCVERRLEP
jgi:RNA polymerase sigma-70 factor (ECF subfamily)